MAAEKGWTKSNPLRDGESTKCRAGDATVTWTFTPIKVHVTYGDNDLYVTVGEGADMTALTEDLGEAMAGGDIGAEDVATETVANAQLACDGELHERWYWVVLSK